MAILNKTLSFFHEEKNVKKHKISTFMLNHWTDRAFVYVNTFGEIEAINAQWINAEDCTGIVNLFANPKLPIRDRTIKIVPIKGLRKMVNNWKGKKWTDFQKSMKKELDWKYWHRI